MFSGTQQDPAGVACIVFEVVLLMLARNPTMCAIGSFGLVAHLDMYCLDRLWSLRMLDPILTFNTVQGLSSLRNDCISDRVCRGYHTIFNSQDLAY